MRLQKSHSGQPLYALPMREWASALVNLPGFSSLNPSLCPSSGSSCCTHRIWRRAQGPPAGQMTPARRPSPGSLLPAPPIPNWILPRPQRRVSVQTNRKPNPPNKASKRGVGVGLGVGIKTQKRLLTSFTAQSKCDFNISLGPQGPFPRLLPEVWGLGVQETRLLPY